MLEKPSGTIQFAHRPPGSSTCAGPETDRGLSRFIHARNTRAEAKPAILAEDPA
jgi:hypothetical protein